MHGMQEVGGSIPPSSTTPFQEILPLRKLALNLLIVYLVALLALLLLPVSEPGFHLAGINSDKWMHVALFGGFAMMLRWNLASNRLASPIAVGMSVLFAAAIEIVQGFTTYRDAEWADLLAGAVGAVVGVIVMNRVLASPHSDQRAGALVVLLGIMVGGASILADVIGAHRLHFGPLQIAGTVLGVLLILGGVAVYRRELNGKR